MISTLDFQADLGNNRYIAFLGTLKTAYLSAVNEDPTSEAVKSRLRSESYHLAADFRDKEVETFRTILSEIALKSLRLLADEQKLNVGVSDLSETSKSYSEQLVVYFESELTSQLMRDVETNMANIQNVGLEVFLRTQSGEDSRMARAKVLMDRTEMSPFYSKDRMGRRHPSQRFVKSVFQQTLLFGAIQVYAIEAAIRGATSLIVRHPEQKASVEGMQLGLRRDQNLPLVSDVKNEIFHPNSRAFVEAKFDAI